jgi:hypothetical protein
MMLKIHDHLGSYLSIVPRTKSGAKLQRTLAYGKMKSGVIPVTASLMFALDRYQVGRNLETAKAIRFEKSLVIFRFGT